MNRRSWKNVMRCVKKEDLKLGLDEQVLENLGSHDPQQVSLS